MSLSSGASRSSRLALVLSDLLTQAPELEAAAVVSYDGLPMASALPPGMDEDRVAAMSAALLSLGERAAAGLGRGELSQVLVEAQEGTVVLVSADDEAVLVAVAGREAKAGLLLFETRRSAIAVADALRADDEDAEPVDTEPVAATPVPEQPPAVPAPLTVVPYVPEQAASEPLQAPSRVQDPWVASAPEVSAAVHAAVTGWAAQAPFYPESESDRY